MSVPISASLIQSPEEIPMAISHKNASGPASTTENHLPLTPSTSFIRISGHPDKEVPLWRSRFEDSESETRQPVTEACGDPVTPPSETSSQEFMERITSSTPKAKSKTKFRFYPEVPKTPKTKFRFFPEAQKPTRVTGMKTVLT